MLRDQLRIALEHLDLRRIDFDLEPVRILEIERGAHAIGAHVIAGRRPVAFDDPDTATRLDARGVVA